MIIAAMERIAIQTDDFSIRLEAVVLEIMNEIRKDSNVDLDKSPLIHKLNDIIFKRLGMKVKFMTKTDIPAAIMPFYPNKNHIFINRHWRGEVTIKEQDALIKTMEAKRGFVNLKDAKVGGFFSEYVNPIYLNFKMLMKDFGMESAEIVAVILHELGHGFNACYYADRTDEANQVIAAIHRRLVKHKNEDNVEYVYQEIKKLSDKVTKQDIDAMLNGPAVICGKKLFKVTVEVINAQLKYAGYNDNAFEEGSDAFASRFGRGKELTIALKKLHKDTAETSSAARVEAHIVANLIYFLSGISVIAAILLIGTLGTLSLSIAFMGSITVYGMTQALSDGGRDNTYDRLKQRYVRIRQEQIELLKQPNIDRVFAADVINAIEVIDEEIKNTKDFVSIPGFIGNLINSADKESIEFEKMLEKLASSDLFIQAAVLEQRS